MASERKPGPPFAHLGLVVGAVALLILGFRHFASPEPHEARGAASGAGGPAPSRKVTKFALVESSCTIATDPGTGASLPLAQYSVEVPNESEALSLQGWLQGSDGTRLDLVALGGSRSTYSFRKYGYRKAPPGARLVVRSGEKVVIDQSVPPLLPPMRAIPLVVPLSRHLELREAKPDLENAQGINGWRRTYFLTGAPDLGVATPYLRVARTEWSSGRSFLARNLDPQDGYVMLADQSVDVGGLAEIDIPYVRQETLRREAELELDIYRNGKEIKVRLPRAVTFDFPDGARVEIPPQERRLPADRSGQARPFLSLTLREKIGRAALFADFDKIEIPTQTMLSSSAGPGIGGGRLPSGVVGFQMKASGGPNFKLEATTPSLETLGLRKLTLGSYSLDASGTSEPLKLGKHRLKLRITHDTGTIVSQRQFVAVDR